MTDITDTQIADNSPLLKPVKEKKPRSEKQIKSFITCQERIKEKQAKQLHDKKIAAAKLLLDNDIKHKSFEPIKETVIQKEKEESSDEEIIYLKREKDKSTKKKPKVKTIILSSSESESETDTEPETEIIPIIERNLYHNNKKIINKDS